MKDSFGTWVELSANEWQALYRYVFYRVQRDPHATDDLMQDIWLEWRRRTGPEILDAWSWLLGVARNLIRHRYRGRRREQAARMRKLARQLPDPAGLDGNTLEAPDVGELFALAMSKLPPQDQQLLTLKYREGRTTAAIAAQYRQAEEAVNSALYRARQKFKQSWSSLQEEEPNV